MSLWIVRYRDPRQVHSKHIEASSREMAELVGRAYVASLFGQSPNETYRYIGVESFVVADESILPPTQVPKEELAHRGRPRKTPVA